jgi:hypothetical protein
MNSEMDPRPGWREMLDFEHGSWKEAASKNSAIRARFRLSPTRYYQLLGGLIDRPEALEYDPMLVRRLRRLRVARREKRSAGRLELEG